VQVTYPLVDLGGKIEPETFLIGKVYSEFASKEQGSICLLDVSDRGLDGKQVRYFSPIPQLS